MNFKRVLKNYTDGLWGKDLVKRAYQAGIITKEEYNYIIAQPRKGEPDKPIPSPYRGRIMLNYQEQQQLNAESAQPKPCVFATVAAVYPKGLSLVFDGESAPSAKLYKYNKSATYNVGDRVKVTKVSGTYIVDYPIGGD